jgi:anti-anti-sigma factor
MRARPSSWAETGLDVSVACGSAGCVLVSVRGELDMFGGAALLQRLRELIASGRITITLDLSDLTFIDTAGYRSLESAADEAEARGGEVLIGACSRPVRRFLDLTASVVAERPRTWESESSAAGHVTFQPLRTAGL